MPYTEVMHKWKHGKLHSGSKKGPKVTSRDQAIAIEMSEKRAYESGKKPEYGPVDTSPSHKVRRKHGV